jgi:hypothetical protein
MASIERTAYPRFKRFMSARELHVFYTPQSEEMVWAREVAGSDDHLLALVTQVKTFNRLGYFPVLDEVPAEVVGHIRRDLRLPEDTSLIYASTRTAERHRNLIRARSEVVYDPVGARKVAAEAIEEAARRKNDPADLINVALERLVEGSFELPAFRTTTWPADPGQGQRGNLRDGAGPARRCRANAPGTSACGGRRG